jgi:hypothetical protein
VEAPVASEGAVMEVFSETYLVDVIWDQESQHGHDLDGLLLLLAHGDLEMMILVDAYVVNADKVSTLPDGLSIPCELEECEEMPLALESNKLVQQSTLGRKDFYFFFDKGSFIEFSSPYIEVIQSLEKKHTSGLGIGRIFTGRRKILRWIWAAIICQQMLMIFLGNMVAWWI